MDERIVVPGFTLGVEMVGAFLLIAWPIFTIVVHIRHERRLKRYLKVQEAEPASQWPYSASPAPSASSRCWATTE